MSQVRKRQAIAGTIAGSQLNLSNSDLQSHQAWEAIRLMARGRCFLDSGFVNDYLHERGSRNGVLLGLTFSVFSQMNS
jgi:hypothetical protein